MDTVVDIEPASFALTPGRAETVTLTVHNHGEDAESFRLSAAGEAADHVVIEPATLLVQPGETGTAAATIALPRGPQWPVGHLVIRFEVVPSVHPDDLVIVEAIASVRPFSEVDAALSPPEASRSFAALLDEAERGETIIITRAGRRIASVGPVDVSNGSEVVALLQYSHVDDDFARDVAAAREAVELTEPAWPAD